MTCSCLLALRSGRWCGFSEVGNLGVEGIQHLKASRSRRKRRRVERWWVTREAGDSLGRGDRQACIQKLIIFNVTFLWQAFILMDCKIFGKTEYTVIGCLKFSPRWPLCRWVSVTWRKSQKPQLCAAKWKQRPEGAAVWLGWELKRWFVYLG